MAIVPLDVIVSPRNDLVLTASCHLIAASISIVEIKLGQKSSVPHWRKVIDFGLKHRTSVVQEAAATTLKAVSRLVDCSDIVERYVPYTVYSDEMLTEFENYTYQGVSSWITNNATELRKTSRGVRL